jgi:uncharacterized membrane protein YeaQ/YmgE (transglycosylase-associated protein family)
MVARIAMRSSQSGGLLQDVSLGLFGGVFGGALFRLIGATPRDGSLTHFVTAVVGAMLAIGLVRSAQHAAAAMGMSEVERLRLLDIETQLKRLGLNPAAFERLRWMAYNLEAPHAWDPYPFILLNLLLSCIAAIQAPIIMMSQGRQAATDRAEARNDYEVNLKAEVQIAALHVKLDELREAQWRDLMAVQQKQIELLERALKLEGREGPAT